MHWDGAAWREWPALTCHRIPPIYRIAARAPDDIWAGWLLPGSYVSALLTAAGALERQQLANVDVRPLLLHMRGVAYAGLNDVSGAWVNDPQCSAAMDRHIESAPTLPTREGSVEIARACLSIGAQ